MELEEEELDEHFDMNMNVSRTSVNFKTPPPAECNGSAVLLLPPGMGSKSTPRRRHVTGNVVNRRPNRISMYELRPKSMIVEEEDKQHLQRYMSMQ